MKRINIFVLLCVFVFGICPAWADTSPFTSENSTITSSDNKMIIDLKGATQTLTTQWKQSSGDVTIQNGKIETEATDFFEVTGGTLTLGEKLTVIAKKGAAIYVHSNGKLIINDATIKDDSTAHTNVLVLIGYTDSKTDDKNSFMQMESGDISCSYASTFSVQNGANAVINGGTINGTIKGYCTAYAYPNSKITVNGGLIKSSFDAALVAAVGSVEVNGGTFEGVEGVIAHSGTGNAVITGGTFKGSRYSVSDNNEGRQCYGSKSGETFTYYQPGSIKVTAGTFSSDDVKAYIAPGYSVIQSSDLYVVVKDAVISEDNLPTASAIEDGQSLDKSVISGGLVQTVTGYDDITSIDVPGTWSWKDSTIIPSFLDGGVTSYEIIFTPESADVKTISAEIILTVNIPSSTNIIAVSVDDNGLLSYDIQADAAVSLDTILKYAKKSPDIKYIPVNSRISEINKETFSTLTGVVSLDLREASNIGTTLDLGGVSVDTVDISGNTTITALTLTSDSKIKYLNANGASGLATIDPLAGNTNITSIDISNTSLTSIDVSGCTALVSLIAASTGATSADLSGCTALETLDLSGNKLLFLDLSSNVTNCDLSGQSNNTEFTTTTSTTFDLAGFIANNSQAEKENITGNILEVYEVDGDTVIQKAAYDSGTATFTVMPTKNIKYFYKVFSGDDSNTISMDVTLAGNKNAFDTNVTGVALDDSGNLTYTISGSATLADVLKYVNAASVKSVAINNQISEVSNESLKTLTALETLDLTNASGLTTLDLSGVTIGTVNLSGNTAITSLTLTTESKVTNLNASGATSLETISTLAENTTIKSIDIANTKVTAIDVHDCTALTTLNANNTGAKSVNVQGCTALTTLNVANNNLLYLDLSSANSSVTGSWSGQTYSTSFSPLNKFNLGSFLTGLNSGVVYGNISSVEDLNNSSNTVTYDSSTGIATFTAIPKGDLKYTYKVFGSSSSESTMDVTLKGNKNTDITVQSAAIDSNGVLSYTIESEKTATLADILQYADSASLTSVTTLSINSQITEVSKEALSKLTNLQSLDLTNASGLTTTTLDLSSVTSLKSLTLSENSKVTVINAENLSGLEEINFAENKNLTEINISGTNVAVIDVSDCTALEILKAKNTGALFVCVDGCESLKTLDVSDNNLLILDLSYVSGTLTTSDFSGQTDESDLDGFITSKKFNVADFIADGFESGVESEDVAPNIADVSEVSGSTIIQTAVYNSSTGIATFPATPAKDIKYTYKVSGDTDSLMDVTLSGTYSTKNKSVADDLVVKVTDGTLSYDIASGQTSTLESVLNELDSSSLENIKTLSVNSQITEISSSALQLLTNLKSLDLTGASGLTNTVLNLDGVTADNLTMSSSTAVSTLTLTDTTSVSHINAGGAPIRNITLDGNENIKTLNLDNTLLSVIDVSGCTALVTLSAKNTGATYVNVQGCENLEKIDVSQNKLLMLDLRDLDSLTEFNISGQANASTFRISTSFDLAGFIVRELDNDEILSEDIAKNIDSVREVDSNDTVIQTAAYDAETGIATFSKAPLSVNNLKYYYKAFGKPEVILAADEDLESMDVTLTGNEEIRTKPGGSSDDNPGSTQVEAKVDADGKLSYEITAGQTATLSDILANVNPSSVKTLEINSQISELSNSALKTLTNLQSLDLSNASSLTNTTLDLDGVKVENLTMSSSTNIATLTLSKTSNVSHINAGGAPIRNITLDGNENIETVNVDNTLISTLDASGCTNLKTLKASSTGASFVNVEGCDSLETLDVSGNSLLFLDLSSLSSLREGDWSGQVSTKIFKPSNIFDLISFILEGISNVQSSDIAGNIASVREIDEDGKEVQSSEYDSNTGSVKFANAPKGFLKYYYNVFGVKTGSILAANLSTSMDVTLVGNTSEVSSNDGSVGPSGAGCGIMKSNELGVRSFIFLAALALMFTKFKKQR